MKFTKENLPVNDSSVYDNGKNAQPVFDIYIGTKSEKEITEIRDQIINHHYIVKKLQNRIKEVKCHLENCINHIEFFVWEDDEDLQNWKNQKQRLEAEIKIYSTILNINEIPGEKQNA